MRRHAGASEVRRIAWSSHDPEEVLGDAIIGSRVFPLRATPPPAPMPSVGTRRSTRVFVPKAVVAKPRSAAADGRAARVLRSGKRLAASEPLGKRIDGEGDWLRVIHTGGGAADLRWRKGEGEECLGAAAVGTRWRDADGAERSPEAVENETVRVQFHGKKFGTVYSRKRHRLLSDDSASDRMFGIVFERNKQRKKLKVAPLVPQEKKLWQREPKQASRETRTEDRELSIRERVGILDGDLWVGFGGPVVLAVLMESPRSGCSNMFARFLVSVLNWMRKSRVRLSEFVAFLLSGSIAAVFSLHGMHFIPLQHWKDNVFSRGSCGHCVIYGAKQFVPLLSVDFSALPSYFKSLHLGTTLRSLYFPEAVAGYEAGSNDSLTLVVRYVQHEPHVAMETGYSGAEVEVPVTLAVTPSLKRDEPSSVLKTPELLRRYIFTGHSTKSRKSQRKRTSVRHAGVRSNSLLNSLEPISVKPLESCSGDFFSLRQELNDVSSPLGSYHRHRKSARRSPVERIKELKAALAEVKQNIDSVHCGANILLTDTDRCWRQEGAEVMLESTGSNVWCIAVKTQSSTRYLHKPQEMRPSVVNRYTNAYMWSGDDAWRLEFCDRWDWLVFKELHAECRARNVQDASVMNIPVPGVQEVSDYDDNASASFVRPETYILVMNDEVERALMSDIPYYDLDSEDEEWLNHLNARFFDLESGISSQTLEENLEKIIFTLEKDMYRHPDEITDKERAFDLCENFGKRDMVAAFYDYWLKKRSKKGAGGAPLVKVFQGPRLKRTQLITRPCLRKKRSFKRQRSQYGRGKPEVLLQAHADEEAVSRVQEAESAANKAAESAINLRRRAQMVMENAELAVYRSVMALRIAEALRVSDSPDLASSILE